MGNLKREKEKKRKGKGMEPDGRVKVETIQPDGILWPEGILRVEGQSNPLQVNDLISVKSATRHSRLVINIPANTF